MPRYDFKCDECGRVDEVQMPVSQLSEGCFCPTCGAQMHQLPPTGIVGYVH